jgi:hypothetical protein
VSALNSEEITKSLSALLAPLPPDQQDRLRNALKYLKEKCLVFSEPFSTKPLLPDNFRYPTCPAANGSGQGTMVCAAQLDFKALIGDTAFPGPRDGLLTIFRDPQRALRHVKDRKSFAFNYMEERARAWLKPGESAHTVSGHTVWTMPEDLSLYRRLLEKEELPVELDQGLQNWAASFNTLFMGESKERKAQLYGNNLPDLNELKSMAAFAQSGISYSPQRASDWHYQHLIDEAGHFRLLTKLYENGEDKLETIVLIKAADLVKSDFDKAWLFTRRAAF